MAAEPHNPLSLDNLHDIVEAAPLSLWWPLAPGWWVVLGLIGIALLIGLWRVTRYRDRNAYRRFALKELDQIESPNALPVLLKRAALVAFSREEVAPLSGQGWIDFLNRAVPDCFNREHARALFQLDYHPEMLGRPEVESLKDAIRSWIRKHPTQEKHS